MKKRPHHPLVETLLSLSGNQKSCVLTEPLWGVPYNLFAPYVSLYMAALGMGDAQIGMIASVSLGVQFFWSLLSGALTDKLGRRWTTFLFDILCWSAPMAIWACAQGYWYFFAASMLNSMWRITSNSWSCMLVEDGDPKHLLRTYTLVNIAGFIAGFFAPIAGLFIDKYTLVPTVRVLYAIAFVLMSAKFVILFFTTKESTIGKKRMQETKDLSLGHVIFGSFSVFKGLFRSPLTIFTMLFLALMTCFNIVQTSFWSLFISSKYHVSDAMLSIFPVVKTVVILLIYFHLTPRIQTKRVRLPLMVALCVHVLWLLLLIFCTPLGTAGIPVIVLAVAMEACAAGVIGPLSDSLLAMHVDASERARTLSFAYAFILAVSTPAGWIAGQLSLLDRAYPLMLSVGIILLAMVVAMRIAKLQFMEGNV